MTPLLIYREFDIDIDIEVEIKQWCYNANNQVGYEVPTDYSHLPDDDQEDEYYSQLDVEEARKEREWINAEILRQEGKDTAYQIQLENYVAEQNARDLALEIAEKKAWELEKALQVRQNKLYIINIYRNIKEGERREAHKFEEDCARMEDYLSLEEKNI